MELSVESFDKICRACLCESPIMKSLFTKPENQDQSLLDIFSLAANLSVRMEDELPKQVCGDCELMIHRAEEFRNRCLISETLLKKVVENSNRGQYFDTIPSECYKNDDKTNVFSDFELQADEKNKSCPNSHLFETEDSQRIDTAMLDYVKKEMSFDADDDFENGFDDEPLATLSIELKKETQLPKPRQRSLKNKLQWKNKKKVMKNKDLSSKSCIKFECKKCDINFGDMLSWEDHIQTQHPIALKNNTKLDKIQEDKRLFQCSLCFRRCKTKKTLSKHFKLHELTDNVKYTCDKCKREFKYKSFLESHVISVHMHNEFTCHLCTDKFTTKESLEAHIDSHKEKKKHVCNICSKAFIMLCTLKDHMRKHTGEKPFLCSTCGKGFSQKTNLAQHTRRHLGVKPYKCDICSKGFVSKGELDAHNRKHSGAHPFVCDDCGNGFTTSSALVKHRRTHTGERPYACDLCPMRFAASGTLKNHRRTHTGERPFQCSLCEKAFVQRTDLISHIRCHTGERPYICNECGQAFRKAAALKAHIRMHGKESGTGMMHGHAVHLLHGMHEGQLHAS